MAFSALNYVGDFGPLSKVIALYVIFNQNVVGFRVLSLRVDGFDPTE